jgi:hypothetical protein
MAMEEGVIRFWPRIHPHGSRMLTEQLNTVAKKVRRRFAPVSPSRYNC